MGGRRRDTLASWFPVVLRYSGLIMAFVFVPLVWLLTGRIEPLLLTAGCTAAGLGEAADAVRELAATKREPPGTSVPLEPPAQPAQPRRKKGA
jgi:hypothetical protein